MSRVVFDTNILLSAFLFGGNPETLFELARSKKIQLLTSPVILTEFSGRLKEKFLWADADVVNAIKTVGYSAELIKPKRKIALINDDADNRILECAIEGGADFIVSGDHHLLEQKEFHGIQIVRASQLLTVMAKTGD